MPLATPPLDKLSWTGPKTLAAVVPTDPNEKLATIEIGLSGVPLAALPKYWRPYSDHSAAAWQKAQPISALLKSHPQAGSVVREMAAAAGTDIEGLRTLPMMARRAEWQVLLALPGARIVGFLPLATAN